jgi:hypothetical protein
MTDQSVAQQARAEQDKTLAEVTAYVHEGMRAGRISDESGELLITAAEREHAAALARAYLGAEGPSGLFAYRGLPASLSGFELTIQRCLRDAIVYRQGRRGGAGQVGLYKGLARVLGFDL